MEIEIQDIITLVSVSSTIFLGLFSSWSSYKLSKMKVEFEADSYKKNILLTNIYDKKKEQLDKMRNAYVHISCELFDVISSNEDRYESLMKISNAISSFHVELKVNFPVYLKDEPFLDEMFNTIVGTRVIFSRSIYDNKSLKIFFNDGLLNEEFYNMLKMFNDVEYVDDDLFFSKYNLSKSQVEIMKKDLYPNDDLKVCIEENIVRRMMSKILKYDLKIHELFSKVNEDITEKISNLLEK